MIDLLGQVKDKPFPFPEISTASEYRFYPEIFWESDSTAFRVAIPTSDLIYHDATALTTLWRFKVDGTYQQLASLQASFFGLPAWSSDGRFMIYLRRTSEVGNQFNLMTADGDGARPIVYLTDQAGMLQLPRWLPDASEFVYARGQPGDSWLGSPDSAPMQLPGSVYNPVFADPTHYVYTASSATGFEMRYSDLADPTAALSIAPISDPFPSFTVIIH